jgi:hypothetical protein
VIFVLQDKLRYPSVIFCWRGSKSRSKINLEKDFVPMDGKFDPKNNSVTGFLPVFTSELKTMVLFLLKYER